MTVDGNNRIMIFGPKSDGAYVVEFISIPGSEAAVIRHFQERMPYGLQAPQNSRISSSSSLAFIRGIPVKVEQR